MPTSDNTAPSHDRQGGASSGRPQVRPSNREVENENQRAPSRDRARGEEHSSDSPKTRTDPGSGEA